MARLDVYSTDRVLDFLHFLLILQTLQPFSSQVDAVESHGQAFIQTDQHLTYIVGDISGIPLEIKPGYPDSLSIQDDKIFSSSLRLDPSMLDFQEQPVGMPRIERVIVQNNDPKNNLHLLSISGSTVHFHCSFFQDKIVPPGGNTTFDVVFLARQVGNVENTLYIHTSIGSIKYQVFGVGIPNPYRLRPYLGARVPLNSSFSSLIQMHNPHNAKLQLLEMFSSEGDLHLELPSGDKEGSRELWELQPFETKSVMRANFIGRVENNHTAFIRIKTDKEKNTETLILPVEIEVTSEPGIYSPIELIDFGILRTLDAPKTVKLNLINTGSSAIHITSISVSPSNKAISIDFRPLKLQPDPNRHTTVAHITFNAVKALHSKQWTGKIIIKTKNSSQKLVLPYRADVLHGSLVYNVNTTFFFSAKKLRNVTRELSMTNTFNFSIVIYNVTLPPGIGQYFSILNFSQPVILLPQQTATPFLLRFHPNATQLHFTTTLTIHTNASKFEIQIIVYNGLFKVIHHRPEKFKGQLDFGTMGVGETRSMIFTLRNDNPVDIFVGEYSSNINRTTIEILGIEKGNGTTLTRIHNISEIDLDPLIIKPYHYAVFSVNVMAPNEEGAYAAEVLIVTQFQDIFIPVTLRTAEGSLHAIPEKFVFEKVYPGKIPFKVLQIHSTFEDMMEVTQVTFQPADTRFHFVPQNDNIVLLKPHEHNVVGKIYFDPKKECNEECYVGLPTYTPAGHQWLLGLSLDKEVADTDQYLYTRLQQKWESLQKSEQSIANVTIELDTNHVRGFLFSAQAHLHWPSLVRRCKIKFPLTQIGNTSYSDFIVENPGDVPVLIQILPLSLYPNPHTIIDLLSQRLSTDLTDFIETEDLETFTLQDLEEFNTTQEFRKTIESTLGVKAHPQSITAVLQPNAKMKIKIGFHPKDDFSRTSVILIRNNLTILDTLVVQGQGCRGEMRFSNKKPGSNYPLLFDMNDKHLKNCDISDKKQSKSMMPHFTVRRTFTLRNTGDLSFYVKGFSINDAACEGYGFKILDCDGFEMLPNTSRKIDIAFTPDFTMSRIRRSLTIHTSLGPPANYTLQATVPSYLLSKCSAALPRPNWEPVLYYSIVCVMSFLLFCILVAAYFEADRIIVADILKRKIRMNNGTQPFEKGKVFDLRNVAGLQLNLKPANPVPAPELRPVPRQMVEVNGHIEYRQQNKEPFLGSILSLLRNLIPQKVFSSRKHHVDRQTSREKETKPVPEQNSLKPVTSDKDKQPSTPPILPESTTEKSLSVHRLRKTKSSQKRHSDPNTSDGHALLGSGDRKVRDSTNTDNKKTTDNEMADGDASQHTRSSVTHKWESTNDTTDIVSETFVKEDINANRPVNRLKSRKKSRNRMEREFLKERIGVRENHGLDDKDEISSTTTDSSAGDVEEKNSSARDSTPEPLISCTMTRRNKKLKPIDRAVAAVLADDYNDDDHFELKSKSKAHRNIRVNPKETFGGNVLRPSTLELPYTLDPKIIKDHNNQTSDEPLKKRAPKPKTKLKSDFSELSIQTETFAQKHLKPLGSGNNNINGFSPDALSSSSRSSSYSSIVSSSSSEVNGLKTKAKQTTSEAKRQPAGFNPFGDNGLPLPGPLGIKTSPPLTKLSTTEKSRNPWTGSPPSPDNIGFGLQTIEENDKTTFGSQPSPVDTFSNGDYAFNAGVAGATDPMYPGYLTPMDQLTMSKQPTMMQQLMADRRRRYQEHQMKILTKGEDWPGFDVPPVRSDSLWDSDYNPLRPNAWSAATDSPPNPNAGGLWNAITNSAHSGWNSLQAIWNNTPTSTASVLEKEKPCVPVFNDGANPQVTTFNPFNSMADIWGPNSTNIPADTNWGQFMPESNENKK
ncbi:transmembrane protein 131-like isoform X2 [Gigantopelta aegis]|uniref:transmembrane protein 131-like isoform X2 n=1 Tax=Gigantopelta aegis TaxID=1735272 RepID=UPI001B88872A|nr:transmembrane protein 131-like isoform X2 [Gigantopelta aegis]